MMTPPKYPCVEFAARTYGIKNLPDGQKLIQGRDDTGFEETIFLPVHSLDAIDHIACLRKEKGWAVVAYHNLDKPTLANGRVIAPRDRAFLQRELDVIVSPPEKREVKEVADERAGKKSKASA